MLEFKNDIFNCYTGHLKLMHQNIRSFRKNFDFLLLKLQSLETLPDVILLTEVWIDDDELNLFQIPEFATFAKCNSLYRAGGVVIYISDKIVCRELYITANIKTADVIHIELIINEFITIDIIGVYRLQEFSSYMFINDFDSYLSKVKYKNLIVCGDMNLNLLKSSPESELYLIKMASHGLDPKIAEPTRVTKESETLIDHIFVRHSLSVDVGMVAWVMDTDLTDRRSTVLCIKCQQGLNRTNPIIQLHKVKFDVLNDLLAKIDWTNKIVEDSVSESFRNVATTLESCIKQSTSTKTKWENTHKKLKPWMNDSLLKMVVRKNLLYDQFKKNPNNEQKKMNYIQFKNNLLNRIREAKNDYYNNALKKQKNNPKNQWKVINEIMGRDNGKKVDFVLRDKDGNIIQNRFEVSEVFNDYFCTVR